jgi:murein DD-endopeptidase MepM/ murein hydrolase activator NlpD
MRGLRTSWIVVVTRRRVLRMPLSYLLGGVALASSLVSVLATGVFVEWRDEYYARLRDMSWLRQESAEKQQLVQDQHHALSVVVSELAQLRVDVMQLKSLKDEVRALGRLEGEHDASVQLVRTESHETPIDDSAAVMLGYAYEDLDLLRTVTEETKDTLSLLVALLEDERGIRPDIPSLWPVSATKSVSSPFGRRRSPWSSKRVQHHAGIDIRGPYGSPIVAAAAGRVTYSGRDPGYGNLVVINHGGGIYTWYGHLSRLHADKGAVVEQGAKIGLLGSTGRSTGPHLHFEVRVNGRPVNPERYFVVN